MCTTYGRSIHIPYVYYIEARSAHDCMHTCCMRVEYSMSCWHMSGSPQHRSLSGAGHTHTHTHAHAQVEYSVNGWHMVPFNITASVVPVTLDVNPEQLMFEFSLDDWDPALEKVKPACTNFELEF